MHPGFVFLTALLAPPSTNNANALVDSAPVIAAEDAVPPPGEAKWTGTVVLGATYSDGNNDTRGINANVDAARRSNVDRWTFKGFWNYSETRDDTTGELGIDQRKAGANLKYDYFLTKKLY